MPSADPNIILPNSNKLRAEVAIIGSGPGGAVTAALLAEAGYEVLLLEEGSFLNLESAPAFSREEMVQKYRNGGITVGMGKAKVNYVEGRCVGGGSEINRGLYHRAPPDVLDDWRRQFQVDGLTDAELGAHFDACEKTARVSYLPGQAPPISLKLQEGAAKLGWDAMEVPRLFRYETRANGQRTFGTKESMTETFVPRALAAGTRLLPNTRALRLTRNGGAWRIRAEHNPPGSSSRRLDITAGTVFVACGAIHTPILLQRSGITRNVGGSLRFHPMVKMVAAFPEKVNELGMLDPVHQVKEFMPRFSFGCSMSSRPALALAMTDHPTRLADVDRNWQHMAIYYAQTSGGAGTVRTVPGYKDPLVRLRFTESELGDLSDGLRKLGECLFAAGAVAVYPSIVGSPMLTSQSELETIPTPLPAKRASLSTLHLFSTCRMGENPALCATDSFGKVRGVDDLYVADASLLCGPLGVNPQGSVMAVAHRNAIEFLHRQRRRERAARTPWTGPQPHDAVRYVEPKATVKR